MDAGTLQVFPPVHCLLAAELVASGGETKGDRPDGNKP